MKKFLTIFASLALIVVIGFSLAACGKNDNNKLSGKSYEANDMKIVFAVYKTNEDGTLYKDENDETVIERYETLLLREVLEKNFLATKAEGYTLTDDDRENLDKKYKEIIEKDIKKDFNKDETDYSKTGNLDKGISKIIYFDKDVVTLKTITKTEKYNYDDPIVKIDSTSYAYEYKNGVVTTTTGKVYYSYITSTNPFEVSDNLEEINVVTDVSDHNSILYTDYSNFANSYTPTQEKTWVYQGTITVYTLIK